MKALLYLDHSFTVDATARVEVDDNGQIQHVEITAVDAKGEPCKLKLDFVDVKSELPYLQAKVSELLGDDNV